MTDATILYAGMFCFSLIVLAFVLTINEFRKTTRPQPTGNAARTDARWHTEEKAGMRAAYSTENNR